MNNDYGYTLDATAAKSAENIGKFIRETGKYKGKFTRAEMIFSKTKSRGIEFDFLSDDNKECTMQIWTHAQDGSVFSGINMVNAIMTCLSVRGMKPQPMQVTKYDYDTKKKESVQSEHGAFAELMNKPVGLLLQKELTIYEGKEKSKMLIYAAFQHDTEKTATEILNKIAAPAALSKMIQNLYDKDSRGKGAKSAPAGSGYQNSSSFAPPYDDIPAHAYDDSIPF